MRGSLAIVLTALITLVSVVAGIAPSEAATTVSVRLRYAIKHLPVAAHSHAASYDRTKDFGDWITQYG